MGLGRMRALGRMPLVLSKRALSTLACKLGQSIEQER